MIDIVNTILLNLPKHSTSPNGWKSFNCPACVHRGHPRPDTRKRGGLIINENGGFSYNCFNCKMKTGWQPGLPIGKNTVDLMGYLGIDQSTINDMHLQALRLINDGVQPETTHTQNQNLIHSTPLVSLPEGSKRISELINQNFQNEKFLLVLQYLLDRNPDLLDWYDHIYWSKKFSNRAIFALYSGDIICGWVARDCSEKSKNRYLSNSNQQMLFNSSKLFETMRKYVIVVEGIMDAISIDGVAITGSEITPTQENWLNKVKNEKEIIVVPDRDRSGLNLVDACVKNGWAMSFPDWPTGVDDCDKAVKKLGRILSLRMILESKISDPYAIQIKAKNWVGNAR